MQEATTNEPQGEDPVDDLKVLITEGEAYPELERAFLNAQKEITAGFHIFDLTTRLRSSAARETGETWFDLFLATVNRGVSIRVVVADFDPVCAPALHRTAWQAKRQIMAVREVAKARAGRLDCVVALHSAHTGSVPRVLCYPFVRYRLRKLARYWRKLDPAQRKGVMSEAPRLKPVCYEDEQGRLRLPPRLVDLYPATHHQKSAVVDRRKVYVGGLDLNERRFDTKRHRRPAEATWHDVQLMATGPVAQAAQHHLESFLDTVDGASPPAPAQGFLRTISRRRKSAPVRMAPKPVVREIEDRHERAIGQARQLVYLETQFLRHVPLARTLARRARERPGLRLIVVLPAAPEQVAFATSRALDAQYGEYQQMRCLSVLKGAFGQDRMVVASPVQPRRRQSDGRAALKAAPIIYVHSKV